MLKIVVQQYIDLTAQFIFLISFYKIVVVDSKIKYFIPKSTSDKFRRFNPREGISFRRQTNLTLFELSLFLP